MRTKPFGHAQLSALEKVARTGPAGIPFDTLYSLSGKRKDYAGSYLRAFLHAVHTHNEAVATGQHDDNCASNCPLEASSVERGYFGPLNGTRYRMSTWSMLAERGRSRSIAEWQADALVDAPLDTRWEAAHTPDIPRDLLLQIADREWLHLLETPPKLDQSRCAS